MQVNVESYYAFSRILKQKDLCVLKVIKEKRTEFQKQEILIELMTHYKSSPFVSIETENTPTFSMGVVIQDIKIFQLIRKTHFVSLLSRLLILQSHEPFLNLILSTIFIPACQIKRLK